MGDVYRAARWTLVCLATEDCDSEGLDWMRDVLDGAFWDPSSSRYGGAMEFRSFDTATQRRWRKFLDIMTSPWWTRAWVFQEFMLSRQPLFLYGWSFIDWDDFDVKLERLFASLPSSHRINPDMLHLIRQSHAAREQVDRFLTRRDEFTSTGTETLPGNADSTDHFHPTTDLKGLLYNANFFEASDERDKIYAFLGLTDVAHGIVPHYSEENRLDKVFYDVTKQLILFEDSLEVLKYTWCSDDRTECSQSWVVSWSRLHIPKVDRLVFIPDKFVPKDWRADASFQELPNATGIALNVWGIQLPP